MSCGSLYSEHLVLIRTTCILNASLVLNTCTSWNEAMLVPVLFNQK